MCNKFWLTGHQTGISETKISVKNIEGGYMVHTISDKQLSSTFQGFFKEKLQFSRTKIYSITRPSFTPLISMAKTRHAVIYNFHFFSHG